MSQKPLDPASSGSGNSQTSQPAPSSAPVGVAAPELAPALQGERQELQRKILEISQASTVVLPEDYERGPILSEAPAPGTSAGTALAALRQLMQDLKTGARAKITGKSKRLIDNLLANTENEFHDVQIVRVLSPYRVEGDEAAFSVRLLGIEGSATLNIFLKQVVVESAGQWLLDDLQGDLTPMTEDGRNRYNDYVPQDVERTMIREGHAKPWL